MKNRNKDKARIHATTYRRNHPDRVKKFWQTYYPRHAQEIKDKGFIRSLLLKVEVLLHYSGGLLTCEICGENRLGCLSIDHIGGGGCKHRRELGRKTGNSFYRWLRDSNFPPGFRILCMNCQFLEIEGRN